MKRFLHLFLIGSLVIYFVQSFQIIEKNQHYRSRRCVCLKIQPSLCQCNSAKQQLEHAPHQQPQQFYQEKPLAIASANERNANTSSQQWAQLSICIPFCFQKCMKKEYSRCQQSCQNMCKVQQSIPTIELSQAITQQQQQQLLQRAPEYFSIQQQAWESKMQKDSAAAILERQLSTAIPGSHAWNESVLVRGLSKPLSVPLSQSTGQLNFPHKQFSDSSNNICTHACVSSCPCIQQSTTARAPVLQHQKSPESIVHQPSMSAGLLRQEPVAADSDKMPYLTKTLCASLCMPSCRDQCIHQTAMLPSAFNLTPSPALPYSSLIVQSPKQQYSAKAEKTLTNEAHKTRHSSVCLYICRDNCMPKCMLRNRSAEQCSVSCNYVCDDSCAQQLQPQQQLLELTQNRELSPPIHQQPQQISTIQYPSLLTRIQQLQRKISINEISREHLLPQQQLGCSQQTSGISHCVPGLIISTNSEIHSKRKLK